MKYLKKHLGNSLLNTTFVISAITAYTYLCAYIYEWSTFANNNIPSSFIEITTTSVLTIASAIILMILIISMITTSILLILSFFKINYTTIDIIALAMTILGIIIVLIYSLLTGKILIFVAVIVGVSILTLFGVYFIRKRLFKILRNPKESGKFETRLQNLLRRLSPVIELSFLILMLTIAPAFIMQYVEFEERNTSAFTSFYSKESEFKVIRRYSDILILKPITKKSTFDNGFRIIKLKPDSLYEFDNISLTHPGLTSEEYRLKVKKL